MAILLFCVLLGLGVLFSPPLKPYCVRIEDFLIRMLQARPSFRRRRTEPPPPARDTPYRDSKDARIYSLESENRDLKEALDKAHHGIAERDAYIAYIEELWFKGARPQKRPRPIASVPTRAIIGTASLAASTALLFGALNTIPSCGDESSFTPPRLRPQPTMLSVPATSGGEVPLFERYIIVIEIWRDEPWPVLCQEYELLVLDSFYALEPTYRGEDLYLVWHLVLYASDAPLPYPRL